MIEAFVVNNRLGEGQTLPMRRILHRLLQRPIGFNRLKRNEFLLFILDRDRISQSSSMTGVFTPL